VLFTLLPDEASVSRDGANEQCSPTGDKGGPETHGRSSILLPRRDCSNKQLYVNLDISLEDSMSSGSQSQFTGIQTVKISQFSEAQVAVFAAKANSTGPLSDITNRESTARPSGGSQDPTVWHRHAPCPGLILGNNWPFMLGGPRPPTPQAPPIRLLLQGPRSRVVCLSPARRSTGSPQGLETLPCLFIPSTPCCHLVTTGSPALRRHQLPLVTRRFKQHPSTSPPRAPTNTHL